MWRVTGCFGDARYFALAPADVDVPQGWKAAASDSLSRLDRPLQCPSGDRRIEGIRTFLLQPP